MTHELIIIATLAVMPFVGMVARWIADRPRKPRKLTRDEQMARYYNRKLAAYDRCQRHKV